MSTQTRTVGDIQADKERQDKRRRNVVRYANRYDLTALLEYVCFYSRPDEVRRDLTACYFTIARQIVREGEGAGDGPADALATLEMIIEALDNVRQTDTPPLRIVPAATSSPKDLRRIE